VVNRREKAALLLALRASGKAWADVTRIVEENGSALSALEQLLAPAQPALDQADWDPTAALDAVEREIEGWLAEGIQLTTVLDDDYPLQLLMVHQRPPFLTYRGRLDPVDQHAVAVVGSRAATSRGLAITGEIATLLTKQDVTVLSGLAAGVDAAAHRAVLDAGGRTVAVVGTGLRHCYPSANADLQADVERAGAVISQFLPDVGPAKRNFPMRNAVMSGCGVATVVVEAGEHSGTRIQARLALEHGRHLFLMPEVATGTTWGRDMAKRPNTTVLTGPDHLVEAVTALTVNLSELAQF
jgi:DNA processing protein